MHHHRSDGFAARTHDVCVRPSNKITRATRRSTEHLSPIAKVFRGCKNDSGGPRLLMAAAATSLKKTKQKFSRKTPIGAPPLLRAGCNGTLRQKSVGRIRKKPVLSRFGHRSTSATSPPGRSFVAPTDLMALRHAHMMCVCRKVVKSRVRRAVREARCCGRKDHR